MFFFSSRRRHTRFDCDWSSDVCSSDLCPAVLGQTVASQISGSVRDPSGAVLPGVEVKVTNTDTTATRTVLTNETGAYAVPNLSVGPYRLEAALPGLSRVVQSGSVPQANSN